MRPPRELQMVYHKNIYAWEQIVRIILGIAISVISYMSQPAGWFGYFNIASGVIVALTGVFGYCPACGLVGRKLKRPDA
jgi:hypothetical protein